MLVGVVGEGTMAVMTTFRNTPTYLPTLVPRLTRDIGHGGAWRLEYSLQFAWISEKQAGRKS